VREGSDAIPEAHLLHLTESGTIYLPLKATKNRVTTGMLMSTHVLEVVVIVEPRREKPRTHPHTLT